MQEIYILRHGHAIDISQALDDCSRLLTEEGQKKIRKLSKFFNSLKQNLSVILSSPYLRAKETAEIFASNLSHKIELKTVDFLSAGASFKEIAKGLTDFQHFESIMIVGHNPDLEFFLGKLIGAERINLKKGSLAKVKLENKIELSGNLEWLITPKLI